MKFFIRTIYFHFFFRISSRRWITIIISLNNSFRLPSQFKFRLGDKHRKPESEFYYCMKMCGRRRSKDEWKEKRVYYESENYALRLCHKTSWAGMLNLMWSLISFSLRSLHWLLTFAKIIFYKVLVDVGDWKRWSMF
jgi:hypothetical protein